MRDLDAKITEINSHTEEYYKERANQLINEMSCDEMFEMMKDFLKEKYKMREPEIHNQIEEVDRIKKIYGGADAEIEVALLNLQLNMELAKIISKYINDWGTLLRNNDIK